MFVPSKPVGSPMSQPKWFTREIAATIRKRKAAYRQFKRTVEDEEDVVEGGKVEEEKKDVKEGEMKVEEGEEEVEREVEEEEEEEEVKEGKE
ncbi:hypothetical protein Pcinc_032354 [Petrolisthes cinctipes]|uniref:Uncharacterized protein n=1 Tax=Petrolisthes cinctipes TaxID=88211 RepID=A0AAE1JZC4_PETCI|nr:hypothetical protein Pcinc_032354 [Petrolisthes cinctipes]